MNNGTLKAKPPISPHASLRAVERIGTTKSESAVWRIECTCGATFPAAAHGFRVGQTKCARCQPNRSDMHAIEILMLLPATLGTLGKKTGAQAETVKSRVAVMKKNGLCHIGRWRRANGGGSFRPVLVAGPGKDAPCKLVPGTNAEHKRTYRSRVKKAVQMFERAGKEDPRYSRHIALIKVDRMVRRAQVAPQNIFSALFAQQGAQP